MHTFFSLNSVLIGLLLLSGCGEKIITTPGTAIEKNANIFSRQITIKIGEQGSGFLKRYPALVKVEHQPVGMDFYEIDWNTLPHGVITIEHDKNSFVIKDVLGISAGQDLGGLANEGLSEIDIKGGITSSDLIGHDEARSKTYALLQSLIGKGWQPITPMSDPRLKGKARFDYVLGTDQFIGLDPSYTPTLDEWMHIESNTYWRFYANHVYLTVRFTRERTLTDPAKPGAYLLSFNVKTDLEEFRGYVKPEDRQHWKELLPAVLTKFAATRAQKETELKAKGIAIDETYRDPPVPN
ncbi:hypothetical protein [Collimonas sp. OK412]|uniref:hypothetical protein n=1 Tax=Collimonas sp. (strain OK412) TaxID=1801619 RepID=UPI0008F4320B|nr:hypothetical protein [Collimonas sp. OK412]SFD17762.1 hypothetical protein SAMN04515619_1284 [Collimonas sp. OK412]